MIAEGRASMSESSEESESVSLAVVGCPVRSCVPVEAIFGARCGLLSVGGVDGGAERFLRLAGVSGLLEGPVLVLGLVWFGLVLLVGLGSLFIMNWRGLGWPRGASNQPSTGAAIKNF